MGKTSIEWTDVTWNPTRGCSRVSEGCRNCYAERIAARFCERTEPGPVDDERGKPQAFTDFAIARNGEPHWTGRVELIPEKLTEPLRWRKPRRVFVNSMSDLFHEALPDEAIDRVFAVMALCPQHTFQVLTKRPERMRKHLSVTEQEFLARIGAAWNEMGDKVGNQRTALTGWPLPNIWLGVSVENQPTADERIPLLLQTPAAVRFVSYEPALDSADFNRCSCWRCRKAFHDIPISGRGQICPHCEAGDGLEVGELHYRWLHPVYRDCLDLIIVGGESGPNARPFNIQWARDVIAQCKAAGVACFVKQLGGNPVRVCPSCKADAPNFCRMWGASCRHDGFDGHGQDRLLLLFLKDRKGGDWSEWTEDLRVREFPDQMRYGNQCSDMNGITPCLTKAG